MSTSSRTWLQVASGVTIAEIKESRQKKATKEYKKEHKLAWWHSGTDSITLTKIRRGKTKIKKTTCFHIDSPLTMQNYLLLLEQSRSDEVKCPLCRAPIPPLPDTNE
jgi:hypothetical protein